MFRETTVNRSQQMGVSDETADGPSSFNDRWGF